MSQHQTLDRRRFLEISATGLLAAPFFPLKARAETAPSRFEFCTFTKPLQHMSYAALAEEMARIGLDGIEAPVRPGGHVLPERVEEDLPAMVEALTKNGLQLSILTSGINGVDEKQHTEKVLKTAASLGIRRFRMAYYRYDLAKPIRPQLDEFRPRLRELVALCRETGIKPIYQNHSGRDFFGAPVWDVVEVFSEFDPADIGIAFDIGHATVEGAKAWPLHFAAALPYIDSIYVKEPGWDANQMSWKPLGEGSVDASFYQRLKESSFQGPVSLHVEYLPQNDPSAQDALLQATAHDLQTLKKLLA